MANRNEAEIYINGRRYKISGEESPAYMQKAADYINDVYNELKSIPGFSKKSPDYQTLMMYLNLADKYMKAEGWNEERQALKDEKDAEEISALKMELADLQKEFDAEKNAMKAAEAKYKEDNEALSSENGTLKVRLSRVQDQERQYEEKVRSLEKETDSQRTEISILKRKVTDYVKSSAEQERIRKELEEKVENGGQAAALRTQVVEMEKQIALMQQDAVNTRSSKQRMREEIEKYQAESAGLKKQLTAVNEEMEALKAGLQKQVATAAVLVDEEIGKKEAELKAELDKALAMKESQCEEQLIELRAEYENRIAGMRPEYDALLAEQETELKGLKENLTKSQEAELAAIRETSTMKKRVEEVTAQRNSAAKELETVRAKLNEAMKQAAEANSALEEKDHALKAALAKEAELADALEKEEKAKEALAKEVEEKVKEALAKEAEEKPVPGAAAVDTEELKSLRSQLSEANARNAEMENDMIEYLDLIEEKEREIGRLKYKLTEGNYE